VELPTDTVAVVASESLLGGRFMKLQPGGAQELIEAGGEIEYTQAMPGLEQLIGQFMFSTGSDKSGGQSSASPPPPAP
jgi:phospholipid/cholesterol/gamma-HCH transport system substrate-binding protein